ncbi:unnamed protein product, partial [Durusdinium trenchii]
MATWTIRLPPPLHFSSSASHLRGWKMTQSNLRMKTGNSGFLTLRQWIHRLKLRPHWMQAFSIDMKWSLQRPSIID